MEEQQESVGGTWKSLCRRGKGWCSKQGVWRATGDLRGGREHGVKNISSSSQLYFPGVWRALREGRIGGWSGQPIGRKIGEPRSSALVIVFLMSFWVTTVEVLQCC